MKLRRLFLPLALLAVATTVDARTIYRCEAGGIVSLSTAPEPGSKCEANVIDDAAAKVPNLWGSLGVVKGKLYKREVDGKFVYGTRALPGAVVVQTFTVITPKDSPAHVGLGQVGKPRIDRYDDAFEAASKATGVDDAWLRAIAHAESAFNETAVSPKGAQGVMQLMPATAKQYGVKDPFEAVESITGGALHLKYLIRLYSGDMTLVAAAYNAGVGAVTRYGGVPPYKETQAYVAKVEALHAGYARALAAAE